MKKTPEGRAKAEQYAKACEGYTVEQVARMCGVTKAAIYNLCRSHGVELKPKRKPTREQDFTWCVQVLLANAMISFGRAQELMRLDILSMRKLVNQWHDAGLLEQDKPFTHP